MSLRTISLAVCLACVMAFPAAAQVKLVRKIPEGKTSTVETTTKTQQKLTIAGMDNETSADGQTTIKLTAGKRDQSGNIKVEEKVTALQASIKVAGTEYLFDSANPDKAGSSPLEGLRKVHQVLARRKGTQTFDKDNKLVGVEYDENLLNDLEEGIRVLVKDQVDPERVKKATNEELDRIPSKPISKGDSWDHTTKASLGGGQMLVIEMRYTYEGELEKGGKKLDRISLKVQKVEYTLEADSPLPLKLKSSDLKPTESKGEILFDRELGQVVESSSQVTIKGDMVFVINGTELPAKLDLKLESTTARKE